MPSYAMLTSVGRNKEAAALANASALNIAEIAWGDGARIPAGGETALENEQGRKPVAARGVTAGALNTAFFEVLLAEDEGPFVIREAGLFDTEGDMIAVAYYDPPVNKPLTTVSAHLRINVVFSDLENLIIHVDVSTTYASANRTLTAGTGLKGGGDLTADRAFALDFATKADALAGVRADKAMPPLRVAQVIEAVKPPTVRIFTHGAGVYVTPEGCKAIHLRGVAAGQGGEQPPAAISGRRYGHPGGSGAGFEAWLTPDPGQEFNYAVGAGGSGGSGGITGAWGGQGGNTSFGHIGANGGGGNLPGPTAHASGGDINFRGSPGIQNWHAANNGREYPKLPGGSIFGPSDSVNDEDIQQAATVPGTGGAGGIATVTASIQPIGVPAGTPSPPPHPASEGQDGAEGIIIVTEYY
ncbi:phage tail protein [uncultured Tateyamaria sp.]|uniref:phage tail-collar fiber domain-containing protein n=1 Tax=uncultured Tateyamaria sp. TaxID=455651 RepID=UPI00262BDD26|nr:phage tail protein [uncultured Tateyamaria sp.]